MAAHIRASLHILFPNDACMTNASVYVVEDLHTMMIPAYNDDGPSDFDVVSSEAFRSMMLYWYPHGPEGAPRPHPIFQGRVAAVHLYDSIAFLERGPLQSRLTHLKRGRRGGSFSDPSTPHFLRRAPEYRLAAHSLRAGVQLHAAALPKPNRSSTVPAQIY